MLRDRTKTFQVTETSISQYGNGRAIDDNFDNDSAAVGQCLRTDKVVFFDEFQGCWSYDMVYFVR